ncbi:putative baseplate assembly protein [Couchioplanes azureus]|uniref:putative baseplate assembly protein n=1 Tax=Couchioplanes caeruleus TaxID=56438 RepID=UPI00166FC783|nr:putative baseplate assembly protein [Couchioplanes caeruleus]GGQ82472.1 putative baseplate assembly protein [Couchioplanes caeruleus subsp. azureus]
MPLPVPHLDDRRFQDFVDEAKRRVQERCPEWTDHNVSDPGVTLIETFASMVDQLVYRLNRVPDLHYLRFLELIGVRLFPPTAARGDVTFWLSAPQHNDVTVPAGAQVASVRNEVEEPVVFTTERELRIVSAELARAMTGGAGQPRNRTDDLRSGAGIDAFGAPPQSGDALYLGLSAAVPSCAVLLRLDCVTKGVGVDPRNPPWVWEAWQGGGWAECEVERDTTGGFNRAGDVLLHVPEDHATSLVGRQLAGWLRCRIVPPGPDQPFYTVSPKIVSAEAAVVGGTVAAVHAEIVRGEVLGISEGVPGQRFPLARRPVVPGEGPLVVEVAGGDGWQEWREVATFAQSGPYDRHLVLDRVAGEVVFGPAVREPDGRLVYYGGVPPKGAPIRVPEYRTGGGLRGNVARNVLQVARDPVAFVSTVANRRPAAGGVDGESVRDAAIRGPLLLRTRERAVTVEDYEHLAREAAPEVARVRCVPVDEGSEGVRVLVVPACAESPEPVFEDLRPSRTILGRIARHLEERRCLGARISVEPPFYQGVTVVAQVQARARTSPEALRERAVRALYGYLDPLRGGPDGTGWPFGRPVQAGEVFAVLQRLSGVELVEEVRLFGADPTTGERGGAVQRLDLLPHALVFSYGHQVRVSKR